MSNLSRGTALIYLVNLLVVPGTCTAVVILNFVPTCSSVAFLSGDRQGPAFL